MNAYTEIIKQIVASAAPQAWKGLSAFPFPELTAPKAYVHDLCILKQSASVTLGLLWIGFEQTHRQFFLPFKLCREHNPTATLVLSPWCLLEAWENVELFQAWRTAVHSSNPLITANEAFLYQSMSAGEPRRLSFQTENNLSTSVVKLEAHETLKIYRTLDAGPAEIEVAFLRYLTAEQDRFLNFSKLISVAEYIENKGKVRYVGFSTQYIPNRGNLWDELHKSMKHTLFAFKKQNPKIRQIWFHITKICENLGRTLAEFHRTMLDSKKNPLLMPEMHYENNSSHPFDFVIMQINKNSEVLFKSKGLHRHGTDLKFKLLSRCKELVSALTKIEKPGIKIRTHSCLKLQKFVASEEDIYLIDFSQDRNPDREKHFCLQDLASILLDLKYAWATLKIDLEIKNDFTNIFSDTELTSIVKKTYFTTLYEEARSAELIPPSEQEALTILESYFCCELLKNAALFKQGSSLSLASHFDVLTKWLATSSAEGND